MVEQNDQRVAEQLSPSGKSLDIGGDAALDRKKVKYVRQVLLPLNQLLVQYVQVLE